MNEQLNKNHDPFYKLIQEAGPENPSPDFLFSLLEKLEAKNIATTYEPVISKKSWLIIILIFIIITAISFSQGAIENSWLDISKLIPKSSLPSISINLPKPTIPYFFKTNIMTLSLTSFTILSFAFLLLRNKFYEIK